ncbi:hypothetical protein [Burkholderia sp. WAC0059]|uniref:hypothetical protein n=1 Tax=Burkholderia sp. WAC0059 TaxID=2066022 RepID=UPI0011AEDB2D|nr:hypothetical protein [Burkholderia sp. WAC0059]
MRHFFVFLTKQLMRFRRLDVVNVPSCLPPRRQDEKGNEARAGRWVCPGFFRGFRANRENSNAPW